MKMYNYHAPGFLLTMHMSTKDNQTNKNKCY